METIAIRKSKSECNNFRRSFYPPRTKCCKG